MKLAATQLPTTGSLPPPSAPEVYFLSGDAFWYQTAFCARSLLTSTNAPLRIVIVDDGTLMPRQSADLQRMFPGLRVIPESETLQCLDEYLPTSRFPALRARRLVYPHLRKLTDVHAGRTGWKLVLDSDMLFFQRPDFLLDWLAAPECPCHLTDIENAYGYSQTLMAELAGGPVPDRLNVGGCGLRSDAIDWNHLEDCCRIMLEREGSSYYQEQALTAVLTAHGPRAVAPAEQYVVSPTRAETEHPTVTLHHYVDLSKAWYFRFGWRHHAEAQK